MGLMNEYIAKKWSNKQFEDELVRLIKAYNKTRDAYLMIYSSAIEKPFQEKSMNFEDFYMFNDLLNSRKDYKIIDIYLETPGGSGEAAENIVRFLRENFEQVNFVVSGQAKSAGTILVLSGDEIFMTDTGSLGPIDAQMVIGRSINSSHDYIEWVEERRSEADKNKQLNPFDALMIAQITPGELNGVYTTHKYAQDLVIEWLSKYKFKNWKKTETRNIPVTDEMKIKRAKEIAGELTNRARWKTHGKSLNIKDLQGLGLKVNRIEDDAKLADYVFRIQTVCRFLFDMTNAIKIFATADEKVFKNVSAPGALQVIPGKKIMPKQIDEIQVDAKCNKCGQETKLYVMLNANPEREKELKGMGIRPFPKNNKVMCKCGTEIALTGIRKDIEKKFGKKF